MNARALRQVLIVCRKELRDSLRDRRALFPIALAVLIYPALIALLMNRIAGRQRQAEEITLPVVGRENAPALVDWLSQQSGVRIVNGPADPEQEVREGRQSVVVIIPREFAEKFRVSRPAPVKIVEDSSRDGERPKVERVRRLLSGYSNEIGSLRLVARGVSPAVAAAVQVEDIEVSSAQQRAATTLAFIPMMVLIAAFTGGMQIATDSTAGERERGSLEPLLVNPAPRGAIVSGKWAAAAIVSIVTVSITTILAVTELRTLPLAELGIRIRFGAAQLAAMLAVVLPMAPLIAALQAYISTFARSFKEAQSYMGALMLVPMIPALASTMYSVNAQPWMYPVPMMGHYMLLTGVLGGRVISPWWFVTSAVISLVLAAALVIAMARLFRSERIIFGR
jgi:sodium transport system permease protein